MPIIRSYNCSSSLWFYRWNVVVVVPLLLMTVEFSKMTCTRYTVPSLSLEQQIPIL